MKRYNLIQARGAEFTFGTEGLAMEGEGNDVVEWKIKCGTVSMIVAATLPDSEICEECFDEHAYLSVELEDGTYISGSIRNGEAHLEADFARRQRKQPVAKPVRRRSKRSLVKHNVFSKRVAME
jgi:hypothetical protein